MHILSTYLPPSATTHAVKCNVGEELLVVSRLNRLDVYELLPDGVKSLTSTELLPRIVAVEEISPDVSSKADFSVNRSLTCYIGRSQCHSSDNRLPGLFCSHTRIF